jgi:hypothetical protein
MQLNKTTKLSSKKSLLKFRIAGKLNQNVSNKNYWAIRSTLVIRSVCLRSTTSSKNKEICHKYLALYQCNTRSVERFANFKCDGRNRNRSPRLRVRTVRSLSRLWRQSQRKVRNNSRRSGTQCPTLFNYLDNEWQN